MTLSYKKQSSVSFPWPAQQSAQDRLQARPQPGLKHMFASEDVSGLVLFCSLMLPWEGCQEPGCSSLCVLHKLQTLLSLGQEC